MSSADLIGADVSLLFVTIIVSLITDAPADVPAMTPPCSKISCTRENAGCLADLARDLELVTAR